MLETGKTLAAMFLTQRQHIMESLGTGFFPHLANQGAAGMKEARDRVKLLFNLLDMDGTILDTTEELCLAVAEAVNYEGGTTNVTTTAAEALAAGKGVCQDQTHLFIAAARHLELPARYVSGYLADSTGNDSHLASHAWAEMLVDGLGWVSFDPANDQCATDAYIRLALGLDYGTASPIRGLRSGGGVEEMDVSVRIEEQQ